jgi:hypothetical protein
MKNKNGILMALLLACGLFALTALTPGCTTTQTVSYSTNDVTHVVTGLTNSTTKLDPAKLSQVETALEPVVAGAARRVLKNSPQHSDEIALYLRSVGAIFCDMHDSGRFEPVYLIDAADRIATPQLDDDYVIDIKNAAIAIYKIAWGDRFTAELPPDEWSGQVCSLICTSIDVGLKDAGKPGIR